MATPAPLNYAPIAAFYAAEDVEEKVRLLAYEVPEAFLAQDSALEILALLRPDLQRWHWFTSTVKTRCHLSITRLETLVDHWRAGSVNGTAHQPLRRMSANDLRAITFAPLKWFAAGLVHEGNIIFAGKSKRGKSMLALNMSLSLACGQPVFGHYEVPFPIKVAYCALEDGDRRMQNRINQMEAASTDLGNLELIFSFPKLDEGGLSALESLIKEGYQVIVIDILAKVEPQGKNGAKDYLETYKMFEPIQALRHQYTFTLIMITHLRKAEVTDSAEEGVLGSTGYVGAQDAVWVFTRSYGAETAYLDVLSKDMPEKKLELHFSPDHLSWTFQGEGDEHFLKQESSNILKFLQEEGGPCSIQDIMHGLGMARDKYETLRKRLYRLAQDNYIVKTDRGKYAALPKAGWEISDDDLPFS